MNHPVELPQREREQIELAQTTALRWRALGPVSAVGPTLPAGYEVRREIHRGGQGTVFEALQKSTGRRVAVKLLHDDAFDSVAARARFEREIQILARFRHPNIVSIHDSGTCAGRFFFVMDYIDGSTYDGYIARHRHDRSEILRVFLKICDAVQAAHAQGIVHRDLKPANIRVDRRGEPCVLDFGLATVVRHAGSRDGSGGVTHTGQFLGSLPWASPEQADGRNRSIDARADVYSLTLVLYRTLTGHFPYDVSSPFRKLLDDIVSAAPVRPRSLCRDLPRDLESILLKGLAKDGHHRYADAGALAADLRRHLAGEPVDARGETAWTACRRVVVRHKTASAATLAVILALTLAVPVLVLLYRRSEGEARRAMLVQNILAEVFNSLEPEVAAGRDTLLLRSVLERTSAELPGRVEHQPGAEATVRTILGKAFQAIGDLAGAEAHLRRALELRRREFGDDHPQTVAAEIQLGVILTQPASAGEAADLLEHAVRSRTDRLGVGHPETLEALAGYAAALAIGQELDEAEAVLRKLLPAQTDVCGPDHRSTLSSERLNAQVTRERGRKNEASTLLADVLDRQRRTLGSEHPETIRTLDLLGSTLRELGRLTDAEAALREACDVRTRLLGDRHPDTLYSRTSLANVFRLKQDHPRADALLRAIIDVELSTPFLEARSRGRAQMALAYSLELQNRLAEAADWYAQAEQLCHQQLGDHYYCWATSAHRGRCLLKLGQAPDAVQHLQAAYNGLMASPVDDGSLVAGTLGWLQEARQALHADTMGVNGSAASSLGPGDTATGTSGGVDERVAVKR